MREVVYSVARRGLATSFAEAEMPLDYSSLFKNRFINAVGGAEKRGGVQQLGSTISGTPTLTGIHEFVNDSGVATTFVSGQGKIWSFDGSSAFTLVKNGLDTAARLFSVQMGGKLVFWNGVNRNIYTDDAGVTFKTQKAILQTGKATSPTSATAIYDADVSGKWISSTDITVNDLVYNSTRGAYGIVTAITTAAISMTTIGSAGVGLGFSATGDQAAGDYFEVTDLVELNIIPVTDQPNDNVAVATSGTSTIVVAVSGVNFANTPIRAGDIVYNSTVPAITQVTSVSANIVVTAVTGQSMGDSLVFLKSACPIASWGHVHYGRGYFVDARDKKKVRITGINDVEDFSNDSATLDAISFDFGSLQPAGETIKAITSYQRFLVIAGEKNTFAYEGTNPIVQTSAQATDFKPVGVFPQGCVSRLGLVSIGNDVVFASNDGLQSLGLATYFATLNRMNLSEQLKTTLRGLIANTSEDSIQTVHYPRRSWLLLKIGSEIYCYNYTQGVDSRGRIIPGGSWSLFDGPFAQMNVFYVRTDGTLLCAGTGGKLYEFEPSGVFADSGQTYSTAYKTGWLTCEEPQRSTRSKQGVYIKPVFETGAAIPYTVTALGGFEINESTDSVIVSADSGSGPIGVAIIGTAVIGGSGVQSIKVPLDWRGEAVQVGFETSDQVGPDIISRFAIMHNIYGRP